MKKMHKLLAASATAALLLAGCSAQSEEHAHDHEYESSEQGTEVSSLSRYAVIAYDGGLKTIDLAEGEVVNDIKRDGFMRISQAGDNRHLMVASGDEFVVYDSGLIAEQHGDHFHYFEKEPSLTDVSYKALKPGHVTVHGEHTVLFGDGDGSIQIVETAEIAHADAHIEKLNTDDPHHGVAVRLSDGSLFTTQGTEESRSVLQVLKDGKVYAETDNCPGSHGETIAQPTEQGDVVVMGCTNGPFVYRDGEFHKVPVADAFSRSGNLAGREDSPIVLGDYKVEENPESYPERPTRIALIDTRADKLQLVELGSSYWFRSLGRGPAGEALVLTYDGNLTVINEETGEITNRIPVISEWQEKEDWQEPGPILKTNGDWAYVTDAEKKELVVIDLTSFEVTKRIPLDVAPVEMEVVTGK